jgi:hypothetical protein
MLRLVATPKASIVVVCVVSKLIEVKFADCAMVVIPSVSVPETAPVTALPMFTFVDDPDAPPVPMLIVLIVAVAVAFVKILAVKAVVGVPPKLNVVAAPAKFTVVD